MRNTNYTQKPTSSRQLPPRRVKHTLPEPTQVRAAAETSSRYTPSSPEFRPSRRSSAGSPDNRPARSSTSASAVTRTVDRGSVVDSTTRPAAGGRRYNASANGSSSRLTTPSSPSPGRSRQRRNDRSSRRNRVAETVPPENQKEKKKKSKGARKRAIWKIIRIWMAIFMLCITFGAGWLLFTPSGEQFRFMIADTLLTTRHRHWAKFIIGEEEMNRRIQQYNNRFEQMGDEQANTNLIKTPEQPKNDKPLTELKEISGQGYSGYLLTIRDPKSIRVAVTNEMGMGEKVSNMVKRTGALFGINGGGFADPNWKGNGFQPIGIVYADGKLFYNGIGKNKRTQIVGFDKEGKMVAGNYTVGQMEELGVKEAVSFQPRIIVNGKGLIKNAADGWGIAPRTVIGQKEDGTVLFLVIDGRQTHSIGANLYDCQQLMLENGAVIAANLDGGSSTVLVGEGGKLVNSPASQYGERLLPTAFLVFDQPEKAIIKNIWEGLDPTKIDPSTWKRQS